jgi:diguanylate cyclase (GGDEF)-like protein
MLGIQSSIITVLTLRASFLLRPHGKTISVGAGQLRYVLLIHGLFYLCKVITAVIPGTLIDLASLRGEIIQISLVEGAMAIMLIALSMTGSERYRREKRIERLAARDPLTALYNRRALEVRAPRLLEDVSPSRPGALLLIDIDNFKSVNDLYGHTAGDRLLITLSEMIRSILPDGSLAARLGGDEFVLLLSNASSEHIHELGSTLRERFQMAAAQGFSTPEAVTLSIGASLFDQPPASLGALIEQGDAALYESKRGGRDSIRLVDRTLATDEPVQAP